MNKNDPASLGETVIIDSESIYNEDSRFPYLIVYIGNDSGQRIRLNRGLTTIGRSAEADIRLKDDRISRIHCLIEWMGDTIVIEDKGSKNGTIVNGENIDRAILLPGIPIQIGHSIMKIEYKSEAEIRVEKNLLHYATIDSVTGVFNRHHFDKLARMEISYACRHRIPVGIILIDIDNFKQVNDTYGHQCGDFVLAQFADTVIRNKRAEDLFGRYGGDEFIILPRGEITKDDMLETCERIRHAIKNSDIRFDGKCIRITVSIGFHLMKSESSDVDRFLSEIIHEADQGLYLAKNRGRDRTVNMQ